MYKNIDDKFINYNDGFGEYIDAEKKTSYELLGISEPKRTKHSYPYSYSTFIIWYLGGKPDGNVYTDRLYQWDCDKYNKLRKKYFGNEGQYWANDEPNKIEKFMQEYNDDKTIKVIGLAECCHQMSGYPIWIIYYNHENIKETEKKNV